MSSALLVIAPEGFRDEEYAEPKRILEAAGVAVTTASTEPGECVGKFGMKATADISVREALGSTYDAVAFIGGPGATVFFDDEAAHSLARQQLERGGVLGAICAAPAILAKAGLLDGRRATAFEGRRPEVEAGGATWVDEPVVVDGRIVTGSGPEAATLFGETLIPIMGIDGEHMLPGGSDV